MTAMAHPKILLFLSVGITVCTGIDLHKRIYGGQKCPKGEHLYYVKVTAENKTHKSSCGGSLIHPQWVLTAAHCWKPGWDMYAFLGIHPRPPLGIRLLPSQRQKVKVPSGVFYQDNIGRHDIMLLKLPTPANIQPVALPDCSNPPKLGDVVQVTGFGGYKLDKNGNTLPGKPSHLQCANMHVVDCGPTRYAACYSVMPYAPYGNRICHQESNRDTCEGDSGGGVIYNNMIYGVHVGGGKCVCTTPAVSLNVCSYLPWIKQTIGPNNGK